ncbi:DNA fragmentation factor subunit alpha [Lingula anatina]|uniref:DNAation factor subunit alpha n=1 Tax=Lingula anatina TaxID=7574 RepID=A0A1S3K2D1_LINAN|nr:DNA fragmentation factor subunit alpha [Lingula anatina]
MKTQRPCKIWNATRSLNLKKGVAASNLDELIEKGKEKLGIPDDSKVKVVLEEDGTEVEDNDYFLCLKDNTTFLLLKPGEKWTKVRDPSPDETDFGREIYKVDTDSATSSGITFTIQRLKDRLQEDPEAFFLLSNEELQDIVDLDPHELARILQDSTSNVETLQETCQRYLDDRIKTSEAMELLKLYQRASESSGDNDVARPANHDGNPKRKRKR